MSEWALVERPKLEFAKYLDHKAKSDDKHSRRQLLKYSKLQSNE